MSASSSPSGVRWSVGCLIGAVTATACFLPSFEKVDGSSGGGGSGGGGADVCALAAPPAPPQAPPPGGEVDFYTAWRTVDVGDAHVPTRPGFNLDGTCSCCDTCDVGSTCAAPPTATLEVSCDQVGGQANDGRDNNAAKLVAGFAGVVDELRSTGMTQQAGAGQWSVLVRVYHYNGEANDGEVSVALYATEGSAVLPPTWNGNDAWTMRRDSLDPPSGTYDDAIVKRDDAYVVDNILVAPFQDTKVSLVLPLNFVVELEGALLQARIDKTPSGRLRLLDGVVGGRWRSDQALAALGGMNRAGVPVVCMNSPTYNEQFKIPLCNARDESTLNGVGPCDALSFGIGFTADPIASLPTPSDFDAMRLCAVEFDPQNDTCD